MYDENEFTDEEDDMPRVVPFQPISSKFKKIEAKRVKEEKERKKKQTAAEIEAKEFKEQKKAEIEAVSIY